MNNLIKTHHSGEAFTLRSLKLSISFNFDLDHTQNTLKNDTKEDTIQLCWSIGHMHKCIVMPHAW